LFADLQERLTTLRTRANTAPVLGDQVQHVVHEQISERSLTALGQNSTASRVSAHNRRPHPVIQSTLEGLKSVAQLLLHGAKKTDGWEVTARLEPTAAGQLEDDAFEYHELLGFVAPILSLLSGELRQVDAQKFE